MHGNVIPIPPGTPFGLLVVLGEGHPDARGRKMWRVACACGNVTETAGVQLRKGVRSCGCLRWVKPRRAVVS